MKRIIVDTNVLVGAAYNPDSASRRIVDACREGHCRLVITDAIRREYDRMLPRAIRDANELRRTLDLIAGAEVARAGLEPRVVPGDPEDDKFFAAAWAAGVDAVVTNDRALLSIDGAERVRIVRPSEIAEWLGA